MEQEQLNTLIMEMRRVGNDTQTCEVKESARKIPSSLAETLSAFSNGSGGVIVLGISEKAGFVPVDKFDARAMQDGLITECAKMTPPVRPVITILPVEGQNVLCAEVPEMHPKDKPCYITDRGMYRGSYIRTGDGDLRLTSYEIDRLIEEHGQPQFDGEIVEEADAEELDATLVEGFIRRQRELHPRILGQKTDEQILLDLHVLKQSSQDPKCCKPTLGGLMALGAFPQKFFPRLNVTFTVFPGVSRSEKTADGRRFIDSETIIGPIPVMVDDAVNAVSRNMRTGAMIDGAFRKDVPDYPRVAVREAVANALMHRDYSPDSRGSQVQVNMYADRLEILNPGGLFGTMTIRTLGQSGVSSSRNQWLSNILETTPFPDGGYVVENRGTGYREIEDQLKEAMMYPPRPKDAISYFSLTLDKRRISSGEKEYAHVQDVDKAILDMLREQSSVSAKEFVASSGLSKTTINNHLKALIEQGLVEQTEPARSPKQRYRLIRQ